VLNAVHILGYMMLLQPTRFGTKAVNMPWALERSCDVATVDLLKMAILHSYVTNYPTVVDPQDCKV